MRKKLPAIISEDDTFPCLICGLPMRIISPSHMKYVHGITVDEYKSKFP